MKTSQPGRALIQSFEALRLIPYQDSAGYLTCGWGHRTQDPNPITLDQAQAFFAQDIATAETAITNRLLPPPKSLLQCQFDALASLVFNIGQSHWWNSTLARKIVANDPTAPDEFVRWSIVNGTTNAGLLQRRTIERDLYVNGVYPSAAS